MDDDTANASRLGEPHVRPGRSGVRGLVDPVTHDVRITNGPRFAGAGPHDIRMAGRRRERTDRLCALLIEHGHESVAVVRRLPHAARRTAEVPAARISGHARDGGHATSTRGPHHLETERRWRLDRAGDRCRLRRPDHGRDGKHGAGARDTMTKANHEESPFRFGGRRDTSRGAAMPLGATTTAPAARRYFRHAPRPPTTERRPPERAIPSPASSRTKKAKPCGRPPQDPRRKSNLRQAEHRQE